MKDLSKQQIYKTPFSLAYWRDAFSQLGDVRIICIAAIMVALRVALKSVQIPIGPQLTVYFTFFVNALGASIFGPVVAIVAAAVSDTLGCLMFPMKDAPYFFPFIFVEISGSLLFALFLWRSRMSATRIILSRFAVTVISNLILNPLIMLWSNNVFYGKGYKLLSLPRLMKNLTLFPVESFLLVLFLGALLPLLMKMRLVPKNDERPIFEVKHIIMLILFFLIAAVIVLAYYFIYLPNK